MGPSGASWKTGAQQGSAEWDTSKPVAAQFVLDELVHYTAQAQRAGGSLIQAPLFPIITMEIVMILF